MKPLLDYDCEDDLMVCRVDTLDSTELIFIENQKAKDTFDVKHFDKTECEMKTLAGELEQPFKDLDFKNIPMNGSFYRDGRLFISHNRPSYGQEDTKP